MEVSTGYKKTSMGLIPTDWSLCEFHEVIEGFSSGQTPFRAIKEYYGGNIPWITSGELNYNIITDTEEKITQEAVKNTGLKIIPKGTFLFAITGLEAEGTRGSCGITGMIATTNQSCMALYPKKGRLTTQYLYYYYLRYGNELAFKYCQGTKQQSFTGGIAKTLPIIVPGTIEEQTAIATALTNTDALITGLEKLIAKKRNIKQGAIQQLLQPKKGWKLKKLGEISSFANGKPYESLVVDSGDYNLITLDSISITGKLKRDHRKVNSFDNSLSKGDIVAVLSDIAHANLLGLCDVIPDDGKFVLNQRMGRIRVDDNTDPYFIRLLINSKQKYFKQKGQGSSQKHIYKKDFDSLELLLPEEKSEQTQIATILSDMDAEIAALQVTLEKYTQIKQGMMQQLLTGKIRLV